MNFDKTTEQDSKYKDLETMSVAQILGHINTEDQSVPFAVYSQLLNIEHLVSQIVAKLKTEGRLFYIGAGTSGRLGILDASECPPTFGVSPNLVIGIIAGGDSAIRNAVENAEDSKTQGWEDLKAFNINPKDIVVGIAASGTTPYVIAALEKCNQQNIITGCIVCNKNSPLSQVSKHPIEVIVGPEFVTGSSRMKAGTAQKMVLNMITTTTMIQLGHVQGNKMVDMQLSNDKLVQRGIKMLEETLNINFKEAEKLLATHKNVRTAIEKYHERTRN